MENFELTQTLSYQKKEIPFKLKLFFQHISLTTKNHFYKPKIVTFANPKRQNFTQINKIPTIIHLPNSPILKSSENLY